MGEETRCHHYMDYSFRLAAKGVLYQPSYRQNITYSLPPRCMSPTVMEMIVPGLWKQTTYPIPSSIKEWAIVIFSVLRYGRSSDLSLLVHPLSYFSFQLVKWHTLGVTKAVVYNKLSVAWCI